MAGMLGAEALLKAAEAEAGVADYGDSTLPERFGLFVQRFNEAGLDEAGLQAAALTCHQQLVTRLQFFEARKRYPISEEVIERPLFVTGEPRSGTTLLHALLACDPNGRAQRFWELMHPSPPPGLAEANDPRPALADDEWRQILNRIPKWLVNHPYNDMLGEGLPECERTWAFDFRAIGPIVGWRVPMKMQMVGLPADPRAQFRLHRMALQNCQFGRPGKHWVLKGFHSARLDEMFETYPDAKLIWTHRDPVQVIASRIVMAGELDEGMSGEVDWAATAKAYLAQSRASLAAALASPYLDDPRVHHVRYTDFVSDPMGLIRGYYEKCDMPFTTGFEHAMRAYLRDNKSDRYGKFTYTTDVIGEDIAALHVEFAPYRERFGIEIEQRS